MSVADKMREAGITPCSRCEQRPARTHLGLLGPVQLKLCYECEMEWINWPKCEHCRGSGKQPFDMEGDA